MMHKCEKKLIIPDGTLEHMLAFECQREHNHEGEHVFTGTTALAQIRQGTGSSEWKIQWQTN